MAPQKVPTRRENLKESCNTQPECGTLEVQKVLLTPGAHRACILGSSASEAPVMSGPPLPDEPLPETLDEQNPPLPDEPLPDVVAFQQSPLPDASIPSLSDGTRRELDVEDKVEPSAFRTPADQQTAAQASIGSSDDLKAQDDGWRAILDAKTQNYYFHNQHTNETTWTNPRASETQAPSTTPTQASLTFQARFDKRTGRFISDPNRSVENYTPEARAARQMSHFFDPNAMDDGGISLKAERRALKHSKEEMKVFKQKSKEKKEHRRRDWLTKD